MLDGKSGLKMLKFHFLYDNKKVAFLGDKGDKKSGKNLKIIFPKDFDPQEGETYECSVIQTGSTFTYQGETYDHCLAECTMVATFADRVFHSNAGLKHSGVMAEALQKAGLKS